MSLSYSKFSMLRLAMQLGKSLLSQDKILFLLYLIRAIERLKIKVLWRDSSFMILSHSSQMTLRESHLLAKYVKNQDVPYNSGVTPA